MTAQYMRVNTRIASFVAFNFVGYLCIGITLAVLPMYVHTELGIGALGAGLLVSLQYVATFISRPRAGLLADTIGPRQTVIYGLASFVVGGIFLALGSALTSYTSTAIGCFAISRLAMGIGESFCGTGAVMWALGKVGLQHTAKAVSFSGVATYTALAVGSPFGVLIEELFGLTFTAIVIVFVSGITLAIALRVTDVPVSHAAERTPLRQIVAGVVPYGIALGLGGLGFAVITTFMSLYFEQMHWKGGAISLTIFGFCFVTARIVFLRCITSFGGFRVAQVCFCVEALGLVLLAFAEGPNTAHAAAALIGLGFALVFPSLAVELVKKFPESSRGTALGIYNAFVDFSLFLTGPVSGVLIEHYGYRIDHITTAAAVMGSFAVVTWLRRKAHG